MINRGKDGGKEREVRRLVKQTVLESDTGIRAGMNETKQHWKDEEKKDVNMHTDAKHLRKSDSRKRERQRERETCERCGGTEVCVFRVGGMTVYGVYGESTVKKEGLCLWLKLFNPNTCVYT